MAAKLCGACHFPVHCECGGSIEERQHTEVLLAILAAHRGVTQSAANSVGWAREALAEIKKPTIKQEHE